MIDESSGRLFRLSEALRYSTVIICMLYSIFRYHYRIVLVRSKLSSRRLVAAFDRISHFLLHPRYSPNTTVHHGSVYLADTCTCIENLQTLLAVSDAAGGEYDLLLWT